MSISASWIALAVLILRLLLKKAPKWITVLLWGIVAIRLICPFNFESVMSLIPSTETISTDIMMDRTPTIDSGIPIVNKTINPIISSSFAPDPVASANPLQILIPILSIAWVSGIMIMLIYTVISYLRVKRKIGTAVLLRDNIYQSESVVSPFVLGIIKPKIYLPFNMNEQDMEHVIAHEEAHIRRKDHLWKPLGFLILTIHWFNPLMWLGYVLLCRDIELACDEKVIKELNTEQKADYSQALLTCSVNRRMIAACPLAFGEVGVKNRVKSVLNYKKPAFWIIVIAVVTSVIVAVCFLTNPRTTLNEELSLFLDGQIAEHHYSEGNTDDNFIAIHYKVLDVDKSINKTTVYMWVLYHEYSEENGEIKLESCAHTPTVITAKRTGSHGHYELIEYWTPRAGSYYAEDIKEKFPWHLQGKALDSQRYIEEQTAFCENAAKEYFESNNKTLTWIYSPMLSHTSHNFYLCEFDLEYTHILTNCDNGMMKNLEAEGQPSAKSLRFEKGQHIYWTPDEVIIDNIPDTSKVDIVIYNDDKEIYTANLIFECIKRDDASADFEVFFATTERLSVVQNGNGACFVDGSQSITTTKTINRIVDHSVDDGVSYDTALELFYTDDEYDYYFYNVISQYIIVEFTDGTKNNVKDALSNGEITVSDLDTFEIKYLKQKKFQW